MEDRSRTAAHTLSPYYGDGFRDRREALEATIDDLSADAGVPLDALRPLDELDGDAARGADAPAVVFATEADPVVAGLDRPVVWATPDPGVAGAAIDAGAADAIVWRPGDDIDLLTAKLGRLSAREDASSGADDGPPVALEREPADQERRPLAGDEHDATLYEYLVKTVGDAVYILDEDGRFTFVNDALCEMTGYDRAELLGSSVHRIKDDETVEEAEDALRELLRDYSGNEDGELSIAKLDVELVRKDGRRVPCTDRMTLRPHEDGSFSGTVGTLRDVSQQRRRERILNNLLRATQEMVREATAAGVAERVVDVAMNTIEAESAVVREHDPETDELVPIAVPDAVRDRLGDRPRYDADEGPVGTAFTENRVVSTDDLDHVDADLDETATYLPIGDTRTLSVGHRSDESFSTDGRQFLELLAATAESVFDRVDRDRERRRYQAAVEAADDMLFTLDEEREFTLVTNSLAATLGTTQSALVGTHVADVLADTGAVDDLLDPPAGPASATVETELVSREGEVIPARIAVSAIDGAGADGVVATVQDIRELRTARAEVSRQRRRFAELFETLTDPLVELSFEDDGATIRAVNDRFAALTDTEGSSLRDAPLSAVRASIPAAIADALAGLGDVDGTVEREVEIQTPRGLRYYLFRNVPYRDDGAERAFVVLTDITEVRQQETHLRVLHRLLRHNLRNQTNVILGRAGLVRSADSVEDAAEHAAAIEEASRSLVDASETAQAIQRTLRDGEGDSAPVPPAAIEERLVRLVRSVASEADVRIDVDVARPVPYDDAIHRAVAELLDNAVEFGTPDPKSAVEIRVVDFDEETVRIAVADDGPGIPDAEWSVVAGDREITQLQHASGLGLWLAKWVADMHGGDLRLVSADEDGTVIAVDLPVT
ncbi:PAS domain S-box protein [Halobaculum gomorrense]|uniref:PAS domain S-box-containing protein n=1 Tax=Halobaculum gomorrense TaxID=43928 RepID=A0A1M5JLG7_9EURY|nr:PAS domain S-box protein [Halobaculum gomorrense]SHG41412.1 PAS domain S-box-containing protein [Halobaculum gomorrense]